MAMPDFAGLRLRMRQPFNRDADGAGGYHQHPLLLEITSDNDVTWRMVPTRGISLTHEKKMTTLIVRIPADMGLVEFPDLPSDFITTDTTEG